MFTYLGKKSINFFSHIGKFSLFCWKVLRAFSEVRIWLSNTTSQMWQIGINSIPIIIFISAFMGMVTSIQSAYQFTSGLVPKYVIGSVVGETLILELAPVITALVLSGKVGATIAAELGTMKVTEQIDALESMAINPAAYLIIPRVLAGLIMIPVLTILAAFIGIVGGWIISVFSVGLTSDDFIKGLRMYFRTFDVFYGLIKSLFFGVTITIIACYEGFNTKGGAEGVGKATTRTVVYSCVNILLQDYILASILL